MFVAFEDFCPKILAITFAIQDGFFEVIDLKAERFKVLISLFI